MKVVEVTDKKTAKAFLLLPLNIYKHERYWIRPLNNDIESVFDPANIMNPGKLLG